jgi:RNA-directed DNA polymerase
MAIQDERQQPVGVLRNAKQTGETHAKDLGWVERSVWTDRMLDALERGVKGGVWFSLIDKVYRPTTLYAAWRGVKRNGGSAGSDHQSVKAFDGNLEGELTRLEQELTQGTYKPRPVRRVYIDKPGSKDKRPLGIPAVRDRVVQAALRLVIEPIFEREFAPNSYGFRPGRGCKDALREVERLLKAGYTHVVDADLSAYFDSIPHDRLMDEIGKYIADGRVLQVIEGFLKQDIMDGMSLWSPEKGSPQGAVISPLLSNLYLHPVDMNMAETGFEMIRYADDLVIMCRTCEEAQRALELLRQLVNERGLSLHPVKTRVVDMTVAGQGFEFLGYRFADGTRRPRSKSMKKLKETIRSKTRRSNGKSLGAIIEDVNVTLKGWFEYFKHCNKWTFPVIDGWLRRRLRSILRQRMGLKGISKGSDHLRWPNRFFQEHGLFILDGAHKFLRQSLSR